MGIWINWGGLGPYSHIGVLTLKRIYAEGLQQRAKVKTDTRKEGPMKLLTKLGVVLIGICSFFIYGFNNAEGAEWKLFQTSSVGNIYYYDPTSVKRFPNNILWVWVRIIETTGFSKKDLEQLKDSKKAIEVIKKAQEKSTSEWKQVFEINCSARMVRVLSATLYDTNGNIKEDYEIPSEWVQIAQNSVTNYLTKILCP